MYVYVYDYVDMMCIYHMYSYVYHMYMCLIVLLPTMHLIFFPRRPGRTPQRAWPTQDEKPHFPQPSRQVSPRHLPQ